MGWISYTMKKIWEEAQSKQQYSCLLQYGTTIKLLRLFFVMFTTIKQILKLDCLFNVTRKFTLKTSTLLAVCIR